MKSAQQNRLVLTVNAPERLVWSEAAAALRKAGCRVAAWDARDFTKERIARLFSLPPERSGLDAYPDLVFSVNFHGLDRHGDNAALFKARGVPVAVWLVDNPWNVLSGLRGDFWKETFLFVTDPGFIPGLEAHGAKRVFFLPLATDPEVFSARGTAPGNADGTYPVTFVGRSAFPDKERFFVGQSVPRDILDEAVSRLRLGQRTDFFWWLEELELETDDTRLWPGSNARRASLGAEESSLAWRSACLQEAASLGLTIYGDAGWTSLFPAENPFHPRLKAPLDYYTQLARVYASSPFSLNMMSFLLPQGLNQRHFDVWAAGGFCIMDNCRGLEVFPPELVRPAAFRTPGEIPDIVARFTRDNTEKQRLMAAWREHVLTEHTYGQRVAALLRNVFA